ncbi:hypothetical protein MSPP1_002615 [Malassezia sp. CBS 17886]|nr:hypothetical protein MSPP1_002615 [Malassezia sp. CBS 17886]
MTPAITMHQVAAAPIPMYGRAAGKKDTMNVRTETCDTVLSAARSLDSSPRSQALPPSLTHTVLQKLDTSPPQRARRRSNTGGSSESARRMSDAKDTATPRRERSNTVDGAARNRRRRSSTVSSGGMPTARAMQPATVPEEEHTREAGSTDVFAEEDAGKDERDAWAPQGGDEQSLVASPTAVEAPVRTDSLAKGRSSAQAPGGTVNMAPEETRARSARIHKLTMRDVQLSTDELYADIATARKALHLFLNSRMFEAYGIVHEQSERRLYLAVAYALLSTIKAVMTFEQNDLATAISHCRDALAIASLLRKPASKISSISRFVRGSGPALGWLSSMTPVERHAELVHAECTLLKAVLGIALAGDLFGFLSEALHLRAAYGTYHSLLKFVEWEDANANKPGVERSDNDFRSGVFLGTGCISLILGLLPGKVLKIMEVFGYEGDVGAGLALLSRAGGWDASRSERRPAVGTAEEGVRRPMCDMSLLCYHLVVSTFIPVPGVDIAFAEKVLDFHLQRYPRGVFFMYFHGRLYSTQGLSVKAIECFKNARDIQEEYVQLKHICYWDMALCAMSLSAWKDMYAYFSVLAEENNWSKAVYTYARAAALYQMGSRDEAKQIFACVPGITQKIAGKSIPLEKFVARKARIISTDGHALVLPAMELAYMCHCYTSAPPLALAERSLPTVDREIASFSGDTSMDDRCLAQFLRGVILRNLAYPEQHIKLSGRRPSIAREGAARDAEESLLFVANNGRQLKYDHYLLYFSHYELGRLYIGMQRFDDARRELELLLSQKNLGDVGRKGKYSMQNMAILRSNGALELLNALPSSA